MSLQATLVAMDPASVPTSPPAPMQITPDQQIRTSSNTLPVPTTHRGDVLQLPTRTPEGVSVTFNTGTLPKPSTSRSYGPMEYTDYGLQAQAPSMGPSTVQSMAGLDLPFHGIPFSHGPSKYSPDKEALKQELRLEKERSEWQRQQDHIDFQHAAQNYKSRFEATADALKEDYRLKAQQHIELAQDRQDAAVATVQAQANSALNSAQQHVQQLQMTANDKIMQSQSQLQSLQQKAQMEFDRQSQAHSHQVNELKEYADRVHTSELSASKAETEKLRMEATSHVLILMEEQHAGNAELQRLENSMSQLKMAITSEAQEHIDQLNAQHHQSDQQQRSQTEMMKTQFSMENRQLRLDLEAANAQLQAYNSSRTAQADSEVTQLQRQLEAANQVLQQKESKVTSMERVVADHQEMIAAHQAKTAQDALERMQMRQNMEGLQRQVLQARSATGSAAIRTVSIEAEPAVVTYAIGTPRTAEQEPSPAEAAQDASGSENWEEPRYTAEEWEQWNSDSWEPGDCQICMPQGLHVCVCADRAPLVPPQPTSGTDIWRAHYGQGNAGLSTTLEHFPPTIPTLDLTGAQQLAQQLPDLSHQAKPAESLPLLPMLGPRAPPLSQFQPPQEQPPPQEHQGSHQPTTSAAPEYHNSHPQKYHEADEVRLYNIPDIAGTENWDAANLKLVMSASGRPLLAHIWFNKIFTAKCIEDLEDGVEWQTLTYKIAADLWRKIYHRQELNRSVRSIEERLLRQGKPPLNGRQLYWMIKQDLLIGPYDASLKRQWDLIHIYMRGGNLHKFQQDFKDCLFKLPADEFPNPQFLEDLYSNQVKLHYGFAQTYQLYLLETEQQGQMKSYERLSGMVDRWLSAKHREQNTNQFRRNQSWAPSGSQGHAMAATGPVKGGPKGPPAGECPQAWYQGHCSRQNCPMNHNFKGHGKGKKGKDSKGKGKGKDGKGKGQGKSQSLPPSYPPRYPKPNYQQPKSPRAGNSRGVSPSGQTNAAPCREWINGGYCSRENAKKGSCPYWHKPQCWFWTKPGERCQMGNNCNFLHIKIYEPQNYSMRPPTPKGKGKGKDGKGKGKGKDGKGKGKDGKGKGKGKGKDGKGKGKGKKGKDGGKGPKGAPAAKPKAKAKGKAAGHLRVAYHGNGQDGDGDGQAIDWSQAGAQEWNAGTQDWHQQPQEWNDDAQQPLNQYGC